MLVIKERRISSLLLAQERNRGLLLDKGFRGRAAAINANAKIGHPCDAPKPGGPLTTRQPAEYS